MRRKAASLLLVAMMMSVAVPVHASEQATVTIQESQGENREVDQVQSSETTESKPSTSQITTTAERKEEVTSTHKKKQNKKKDKKKHKKRSDSKKKQKNKKNNKKRVEKKKSTYPSEDEDVFNLTWDEKEERTKTSTTRKMYERSEDKISESKIDKTTDKEKEFFGKRIVNFLKKCYNRCKNFITKIRKITNKMEMIGDLLEDEDIIDAVKRIKRYGVNGVKLLLPQKLNAKIIFGFEDPYYTGKVLGWTAALIPIYGDHINITPDFEKRILKGELKIKGRIRRYKILYLLWKVYKDKDELIKQKDRAIRMIGGS